MRFLLLFFSLVTASFGAVTLATTVQNSPDLSAVVVTANIYSASSSASGNGNAVLVLASSGQVSVSVNDPQLGKYLSYSAYVVDGRSYSLVVNMATDIFTFTDLGPTTPESSLPQTLTMFALGAILGKLVFGVIFRTIA